MSAIPRPTTASSYLKHHPDLAFSSRRTPHSSSPHSSSPQALRQVSSTPLRTSLQTVPTSSVVSLPVSAQLLRPLSPVEGPLHSIEQDYSGSSSYNSTESLVSVLGHQSYDSDQCQSPKGATATVSPGNNGDSNKHQAYDCQSSYSQKPVAKSSPLAKSPTRDRVAVETIATEKMMFSGKHEVVSVRADMVQVANGTSKEQKVQPLLVGQPKKAKDTDNINEMGDDNYGHSDYNNHNDNRNSMSLSQSATTQKPRRAKKNYQHNDYGDVISEPLDADKDKLLAENSLSELENRDPLQLTAWEEWMLSKAKQEREKRLAEMKRVSKAKAQVQKAAREKDEKEKRIQEQLSQWCLKKRLDNDLKKLKKRQQELMEEQHRRQKQEAEQRAEENFRLWLAAKAQLTRDAKQREKQRREKQEEEQRRRHQMSAAEFEKWCQKVENRSRRRHNSGSSSNSKDHVTGGIANLREAEFEKGSPFTEPEPGFYNPIPWQPTVIPSAKASQRCRPCRSRYLSRTKCW